MRAEREQNRRAWRRTQDVPTETGPLRSVSPSSHGNPARSASSATGRFSWICAARGRVFGFVTNTHATPRPPHGRRTARPSSPPTTSSSLTTSLADHPRARHVDAFTVRSGVASSATTAVVGVPGYRQQITYPATELVKLEGGMKSAMSTVGAID